MSHLVYRNKIIGKRDSCSVMLADSSSSSAASVAEVMLKHENFIIRDLTRDFNPLKKRRDERQERVKSDEPAVGLWLPGVWQVFSWCDFVSGDTDESPSSFERRRWCYHSLTATTHAPALPTHRGATWRDERSKNTQS